MKCDNIFFSFLRYGRSETGGGWSRKQSLRRPNHRRCQTTRTSFGAMFERCDTVSVTRIAILVSVCVWSRISLGLGFRTRDIFQNRNRSCNYFLKKVSYFFFEAKNSNEKCLPVENQFF